ncbi:3-oxoadipate enol-lactonase [Devosia pacifica]|uniref:3-oxoadipate enol-lactonase n=1 Tax=Devosia pacifica TaxID=1335967 RepID=A0A918S0C7_9HYPH|nr:3-oxoadipate enol-lactonase [Devosia pacifica]GHA18051.1 3-oxoadipate enol-lactonase [Devosia pacifica]
MQFARVNDVVLHYQMIGDPNTKPLIVFANALGTDFRIWRDVIIRLVGDFSVLTYDKRGHGLSETGPTPYTMDNHVEDLAALLELVGARQVFVCGVSIGGMIAQGLASSRPDLVRAVVLCDTAAKIGDDASWNQRIEAVNAGGIEAIADSVLEKWFTPAFRKPDNPEFAGYRTMLTRQSAEGYAATCAALRDADLTDAAKTLTVPSICIVGDEDGSTPPSLVADFAKTIPNTHFEVIKGAGHLPSIEQPERLTDIVRAFAGMVRAGGRPN